MLQSFQVCQIDFEETNNHRGSWVRSQLEAEQLGHFDGRRGIAFLSKFNVQIDISLTFYYLLLCFKNGMSRGRLATHTDFISIYTDFLSFEFGKILIFFLKIW